MADFRYLKVYVDALFKASLEGMHQIAENVKIRMMEEGKPIQYPVQWDSPKQRAAFFASNGFGKGIPYKRTHKHRLGWQTTRVPFGQQFRVLLGNKSPAGAISGMLKGSQWQSRIHRNRWTHILVVLWEELGKLPNEIGNRIKAVAV
jgi:hypothetical protein